MKKSRSKTYRKKVLIFICILFAAVGIYALSVNFFIIGSSKQYTLTEDRASELSDIDCVMILGCGIRPDGSPSDMLRQRLDTGCSVFEKLSSGKLLLTGDNKSEEYNELATMKRISLLNGIDEEKIAVDDYGFSTYESMYNAKNNFGIKKMIVITQSYHMPRALYIARSLGIEAYGVTAPLPLYPKQIIWSSREVLARNKDFIMCAFMSE